MSVCVCVCGRAGAYVCMCARACVWVPGRQGVCMRVRTRSPAYPACKAHAPYYIVIYGLSGSTIFFDIIS